MTMKHNHLIYILLLSLFSNISHAQTYNFESATIPAEWVSGTGSSLSITNDHFKEGIRSIYWESTGKSSLTVNFTAFTASTGNSAFMQIYTPEITNDTLIVEFLYNNSAKKTANYLLNYKGWAEFNRAYTEYASYSSSSINAVRFTLKPTANSTRKIYFDDVRFNQSTVASRIPGSQWILDRLYFTTNYTQLDFFANTPDIPLTQPTTSELLGLNSLRNTLKRVPASNSSILTAAKIFTTGLGITRNADGTIKGKIMDMSATALTTTGVTDYVTKLEALAAAALTDPTNNLPIFNDLLDHLIDQGFAEGVSFTLKSNDYTPSRTIPSKLLNILPACTPDRKIEVLKLARWISFYGMIHESQSRYLSKLESDVIYLFTPHITAIALFQTDDAVAVREMKAVKRFLDRHTEYAPGGDDILKPDGTGFHHGTHYNNYMYSYKTWTEYMYYFKCTQYKIATDSYLRFKKAVLAVYKMATMDVNNGDTRFFANSLSGRNPYGAGGVNIQFSKALFEQLIEVGNDCLGTPDTELQAAYNYFFNSTKYSVPAKNYEGFYQFNYSPIGVYRKANWVATMRAPTTEFFGAEIYSATNRFGRYQSHGSLEIMYNGSLVTSGLPSNSTGGGWDWNVVPGATTVHYTSWPEMMPNKNTIDRFDQYTKTKNFSGALSWGDCGVFATDFDQIDTWGGQKFTATNLVFKKSVFAFDNILISLGSNITSSGTYDASMITATNLFQSISTGNLILNGSTITKPNTTTISTTDDNWLITAQGTGYFIPKGNDPIEIRYNDQTTPKDDGSDYLTPATSSSAAKAYLNHGVKPSTKSYSFVVVPSTNTTAMQTLATQMANGGGSVYQIQSQTGNLHALTYKPTNTTAYTFFGASSNLTFGIVKSATAEHLLMHRPDAQTGRQYFAATNPNLKPISDATYGWRSSSSQTTLTIKGEWLALEEVQGVQFQTPANGETQLTLTFNDGEPIYFTLKSKDDTALKSTEENFFSFTPNANELLIRTLTNNNGKTKINIFNQIGQIVYKQELQPNENTISIPLQNFKTAIYICKAESPNGTQTFKWIKN